jgi:hypothetical protein
MQNELIKSDNDYDTVPVSCAIQCMYVDALLSRGGLTWVWSGLVETKIKNLENAVKVIKLKTENKYDGILFNVLTYINCC